MARPANNDLFHSFRFFATIRNTDGDMVSVPGRADAGFSAITTPEYTLESVEYREGHFVFTQKYPGIPTVSDITLSRGVVIQDTGFYKWLLGALLGGGEYRADVDIYQFHRTGFSRWSPGEELPTAHKNGDLTEPYRKYGVKEAIPIRVKPAGDLDATASDVSVAEADVAYEYFTIEDHGTYRPAP